MSRAGSGSGGCGRSSASRSTRSGPRSSAGSLLVALILLAEFGTFEILRFQTFTTQIYTEFQLGYSTTVGCALSLVLVLLGLMVLAGEAAGRGRAGAARRSHVARPAVRGSRSGSGRCPVVLGLVALLAAGDRAARLRARLLVRPGDLVDPAADLDRPAPP